MLSKGWKWYVFQKGNCDSFLKIQRIVAYRCLERYSKHFKTQENLNGRGKMKLQDEVCINHIQTYENSRLYEEMLDGIFFEMINL